MAVRTSGAVAPGPVTSTFVKTGWCTTAPSSAAIQVLRSRSTPLPMCGANLIPRSLVLRIAPCRASIRYQCSTRGALHSAPQCLPSPPATSCISSSCPPPSHHSRLHFKIANDRSSCASERADPRQQTNLKLKVNDRVPRMLSRPRTGKFFAVPAAGTSNLKWRSCLDRYIDRPLRLGTCRE